MAADILAYQTDVVPVGDDQRQHMELAVTLARRFNSRYGPVFTVPRGVIQPEAARIKDLRDPTAKMGKTGADGAGVIFLRDRPDIIVAKVRRAVTDTDPSLTYDPQTRPGVANLAVLLGQLTDVTPEEALIGIRGAGELKARVCEALIETLAPIQKLYAELRADTPSLLALLQTGADAIPEDARATVARARAAMGLLSLTKTDVA